MNHSYSEVKPPDRVVRAVLVRPEYKQNTQYVGVLQWCNGPDIQPIPGEAASVAFSLKAKAANGAGPVFFFRALKLTLSLMDCSKKAGEAAVLKAFTDLFDDAKIIECVGKPFENALANDKYRQEIIDTIIEQFNNLHENN